MNRVLRLALSLVVVLALPASASASLPRVLTQSAKHPFQVRPSVIDYTGDGTGVVGGPNGTDVHHLGSILWPTYTHRQAIGTGLVWLDDCEPDCADGTFNAMPVRIHAFSPRHHRFRRLTLKYTYQGKQITDKRAIRHFPGGSWEYDIVGVSP